MKWLLLSDAPARGPWNMALDEALLETAGTEGLCTLRLYAWDPATLSFGRNEPARRRYDRDAIAQRGLATVRRPTGGRAVWHHREVTYAVAAPDATFGSLRDTYLEIHAMIADALRNLGASVVLAGDRLAAAVGAGACFAAAAGGEVTTTNGRKVVGSAQVRSAGAFLQHGSILLAAEQDVVSDVTLGHADPPSATGLAEMIGPGNATWDAVSAAVAGAASRRWSSSATPGTLPDAVRRRAESRITRFEDEHWTWRR
jgi:lipoate-protein ligase A